MMQSILTHVMLYHSSAEVVHIVDICCLVDPRGSNGDYHPLIEALMFLWAPF